MFSYLLYLLQIAAAIRKTRLMKEAIVQRETHARSWNYIIVSCLDTAICKYLQCSRGKLQYSNIFSKNKGDA